MFIYRFISFSNKSIFKSVKHSAYSPSRCHLDFRRHPRNTSSSENNTFYTKLLFLQFFLLSISYRLNIPLCFFFLYMHTGTIFRSLYRHCGTILLPLTFLPRAHACMSYRSDIYFCRKRLSCNKPFRPPHSTSSEPTTEQKKPTRKKGAPASRFHT